jgi:ferredoxin-thioredoxin reductase catalytic subunit
MENLTKEESELLDKLKKYAYENNFKLNPNEKALLGIIRGLLRNKQFKGDIYCPCRQVTGNKNEDKKIICPCIYHKQEIKEMNHCKCTLFWENKITTTINKK